MTQRGGACAPSKAWTCLGRILVPILGTGVGLQPCHCSNDGQVLELCIEARISGPCRILASLIWMIGPLYSGMFKAWISPRRLPEVSAMRKTVFHVSSWSNVWSSGSKGGFVKADKTKTLEIDIDGVCSISIFRSSDFSAGFRPTSALEVARRVLAIACNGWDSQMFIRVKMEKKIRHYTLSSREWINVLYVTPSSEDPPLGLIDHQSSISLGSTDIGGNVDRTVSAAEGNPGYSPCV